MKDVSCTGGDRIIFQRWCQLPYCQMMRFLILYKNRIIGQTKRLLLAAFKSALFPVPGFPIFPLATVCLRSTGMNNIRINSQALHEFCFLLSHRWPEWGPSCPGAPGMQFEAQLCTIEVGCSNKFWFVDGKECMPISTSIHLQCDYKKRILHIIFYVPFLLRNTTIMAIRNFLSSTDFRNECDITISPSPSFVIHLIRIVRFVTLYFLLSHLPSICPAINKFSKPSFLILCPRSVPISLKT